MKTLILILAVLAVFSVSVAQPSGLDTLIEQAGTKAEFPQASAISIFDRTTIRLGSMGETYTRREFLVKIVDERAKSEEGDQSIRFDSEHDTVIVEAARTRLPAGTWIEPEKDAFTITSAPEVQWASAYSQLKQQNISFPGLDVGSAILLSYRIEPKAGAVKSETPRAGGISQFGGTNPILQKSLTIIVEPERKIQYEAQNTSQRPFIVFDGKTTTYRWEYWNLEQIITEPGMVSLSYLVPRILWTTHQSWEELGTYVGERFWGAVDTASYAISEYSKLTPSELRSKPALNHAALWVIENIRDVNLPLGRVGYEPNTADRVWQNKYGDPRDKAVLLAALARGYGFEVIPVLIPNRDVPMSRLPVLEQFAHIILAVPQDGDTLWLDPTTEFYPPGSLPYNRTYGFACLLTTGAPALSSIWPGEPAARGVTSELRATLKSNGDLSGTVYCTPLSGFAARARQTFKNLKSQEEDIFFQQTVSAFGQGSTSSSHEFTDPADLTTPFTISMMFDAPEYAVLQEDLLIFELPGIPFGFAGSGFYPSLPEVRYPVQLPGRYRSTTDYSIVLPKEYGVAYLPAPVIIDNPYVYLEIGAKERENILTWYQVVEFKQDRCSVEDYQILRGAFQAFAQPKIRLALMEKKS